MFELGARYVNEGEGRSNQLGNEARVLHWESAAQLD